MKTVVHYHDLVGVLIVSVLFEKEPEEIFGHKLCVNGIETIGLPFIAGLERERPFCVRKIGRETHKDYGELNSVTLRLGGRLN